MVKQHTYKNVTLAVLFVVALLVIALLVTNKGVGLDGSGPARSTVVKFGDEMQKVSLLSPEASSTMASTYGSLVTPELLQIWQKDPVNAPGRLASGPYPARIDIASVAKQGSGYAVSGVVILETSTGSIADRIPLVLQVVPHEDEWLIAVYQIQSRTTPAVTKRK